MKNCHAIFFRCVLGIASLSAMAEDEHALESKPTVERSTIRLLVKGAKIKKVECGQTKNSDGPVHQSLYVTVDYIYEENQQGDPGALGKLRRIKKTGIFGQTIQLEGEDTSFSDRMSRLCELVKLAKKKKQSIDIYGSDNIDEQNDGDIFNIELSKK